MPLVRYIIRSKFPLCRAKPSYPYRKKCLPYKMKRFGRMLRLLVQSIAMSTWYVVLNILSTYAKLLMELWNKTNASGSIFEHLADPLYQGRSFSDQTKWGFVGSVRDLSTETSLLRNATLGGCCSDQDNWHVPFNKVAKFRCSMGHHMLVWLLVLSDFREYRSRWGCRSWRVHQMRWI